MAAGRHFTVLLTRNFLLNAKSDDDSTESEPSNEKKHVDSSYEYQPPVNGTAGDLSDSQGSDGNDSNNSDIVSLHNVANPESTQGTSECGDDDGDNI